jgi:hypothetical protein
MKQPSFRSRKLHNRMKESVLRDFGVKSETQLVYKMNKECQRIPCVCCGKQFDIDHLHWIDGDPYCFNCY